GGRAGVRGPLGALRSVRRRRRVRRCAPGALGRRPVIYRRAASPLHAARAAAGSAYCAALAAVALIADHPVILAAVLVAEVCAAAAAGTGRQLRRAALLTAPFALAIAVINPIVT